MKSLTYLDGEWREGNPAVLGPASLATWLASVIFDGARAFEGVAPDLDLHCQRACRSATNMGMKSPISAEDMEKLALEGIKKFDGKTALYIKPIIWAEDGWIFPDPETSRFMLHIFEAPLPEAAGGFSAHISSRRRPAPDQAPTDAKAACLYPNAGRAMREAKDAGFDNAVMLDPVGNVAEFATANIFMAKDGVVKTPVPNGTFLNGITRQRVIKLLREDGVTVEEISVTPKDLREADEIWSTGNHAKVVPVTRFEDRQLQPGPLATRSRELYWKFAKSGPKV